MKSLLLLTLAAHASLAIAKPTQGPGWPEELERRQFYDDEQDQQQQQPTSGPLLGPRMNGPLWQPLQTDRIQYILDRRVIKLDPEAPLIPDADIWDVDLFDTPKETFEILHAKGKRVMCYFSGGGSESWRADAKNIQKSDMGDSMPKWPGERYLNLRSPTVWKFMQKRIRLAFEKGCDAIDPDNVDPFNDDFDRGGGFKPKLTTDDSVVFLRKMAAEAKRYGMSIGLKNAESILPNVTDIIQFAVNEECSTYEQGCKQYTTFLQTSKPVFHYEYIKLLNRRFPSSSSSSSTSKKTPQIQSVYPQWSNLSSSEIQSYYCLRNNFGNSDFVSPSVGRLFSTAIKSLDLGGWVMYCDGSVGDTPTAQTVDASEARRGGSGNRGRNERTREVDVEGKERGGRSERPKEVDVEGEERGGEEREGEQH